MIFPVASISRFRHIVQSSFLSFFFILSIVHFGYAQDLLKGTYDSKSKTFVTESGRKINDFRHGLSPYYITDLYGVIDTNGRIVCKPKIL